MKVYIVMKEYVPHNNYVHKVFLNEDKAYECCNSDYGLLVEEHEVIE